MGLAIIIFCLCQPKCVWCSRWGRCKGLAAVPDDSYLCMQHLCRASYNVQASVWLGFLTAGQAVLLECAWKWACGIIRVSIGTHPTPRRLPSLCSAHPEMLVKCNLPHLFNTHSGHWEMEPGWAIYPQNGILNTQLTYIQSFHFIVLLPETGCNKEVLIRTLSPPPYFPSFIFCAASAWICQIANIIKVPFKFDSAWSITGRFFCENEGTKTSTTWKQRVKEGAN